MKKIALFFGGMIITSSCVTDSKLDAFERVVIEVSYEDVPDEGVFQLEYVNEGSRAVCLSVGEWPNVAGKLNQASDVVSISIGMEVFPIADFNTGMCLEGICTISVDPAEKISGYLLYDDFSLPKHHINSSKQLSFSPPAFFCE